jgi:kynurenine formamidase
MSDPDFLASGLMETLSNWGRWGVEDQRGTLNLITPDRTCAAATLVIEGRSVSCSRRLAPRTGRPPGREYLHFMLHSGESAPLHGFATADDWFAFGVHGVDFTHLDAHSHLFWDGRMYNDRPASLCTHAKGALVGGVESAFSGIVGRGVLIDVPELTGQAWSRPEEPVTPEMLTSWCVEKQVTVQSGDTLFVRMGRDRWEAAGETIGGATGSPGLHASCLPWLKEHDVSVLVSDVISDVMPSGADMVLPIHVVGLVAMGMWLVDNADLAELSETCAALGRYEFFSTIAPLSVNKSTGSLVNPIAVF